MTEPALEHSHTDVMSATVRGRYLSLLLLALAIGLIVFSYRVALPTLNAALQTTPAPQAIAGIKGILLGFTVLVMVCAATLIWSGCRMLRTGQSPPLGAWVWRDTKIVRGRMVKRLAWTYIVSALVSCILCIGLVAYMWTTFDRLATAAPLPAGVSVVPQPAATPQ